jgi:NAD+ dependent glucose-6-phosphate dehydrogenase
MDDTVLLTGAKGAVGTAIREGLADQYDWRYLFHNPPPFDPDHPYLVGDVEDRDVVTAACECVGAVVHLAGDPRRDAPWDSVLESNIHGTKVLYEAAVDANVGTFVYASSNHAVGHYESDRRPDLYRADEEFRLDGTEQPRPGNLYGISKATGELIGRYYHDEYGIDVCNIRIGNLTRDHPPAAYERGQAMWLSYRDCAHIHDCALRADYDYEIVYGISDNDRKFYSLQRAREVLGYDPQDNSAEYTFEGEPKDGEGTD